MRRIFLERVYLPLWFLLLALYSVFNPKIGVFILGLYVDSGPLKKSQED